MENGEDVLVHNNILVEAADLLQRRLGLESALQLFEDSRELKVHWLSPGDHEEARRLLGERGKRDLGLVGCASFNIMHHHHVSQALAFDAGFEQEGFILYQGPGETA